MCGGLIVIPVAELRAANAVGSPRARLPRPFMAEEEQVRAWAHKIPLISPPRSVRSRRQDPFERCHLHLIACDGGETALQALKFALTIDSLRRAGDEKLEKRVKEVVRFYNGKKYSSGGWKAGSSNRYAMNGARDSHCKEMLLNENVLGEVMQIDGSEAAPLSEEKRHCWKFPSGLLHLMHNGVYMDRK